MTSLFKHQRAFLAERKDKTALIWSCGTGKSRAACEWSKQITAPALVICPKALKTNWKREGDHWGAILEVLTKEEFRARYKTLSKFKQIIVDEVHNGFLTPHFKSQMSKALRWYLNEHEVKRVLLLSATPYTSSPWNIYNLALYTGHKWPYREFDNAYFNYIRMGFRLVPVVKKGSEKRLAIAARKIASVVNIHDVMDVPLQNHLEPEYFALSLDQERAITDNYDPLPIVRYTKQHEIENGILIGNEFSPGRFFHSDKNERIMSLIEENKKVAIVCRYNKQISALKKLISDAYIIQGDVKDRDAVCLAAEKAERAVVLIQADCAEGYELPSFELCIFASQSYAYTKWEQICGRFLRMNKPTRTTFMYLLTEGNSVDQAVFDAIKRKEDFKIELYGRKS